MLCAAASGCAGAGWAGADWAQTPNPNQKIVSHEKRKRRVKAGSSSFAEPLKDYTYPTHIQEITYKSRVGNSASRGLVDPTSGLAGPGAEIERDAAGDPRVKIGQVVENG